ncbi:MULTISPECIES: co-regulatory protein PtrA N-terminal domain-containing protein [Pseudomonas]|uniref:Uncharacterized protein n=2 Tax=Pseudomonas TaxID=286 RepID=A0A6G1W0G3_9PSED|nr:MULTISPECIES: co-regulatory protein PtrA N-terminal domain-containing protein [Pseudomonas]MDE4515878.1 hypothetical protein [Pseudomonas fragi]MDY7571384.1 co-regulatory protein PtrA N-terminal domain-containing protein [Pseudomonas sp. CCC4.1]MEB0145279.1 co-regulatory protein PtrA N-terminal domain-containing protein [Pseudomonas sp. CCC4.1]MQT24517.1 hypothetical protein [Pseudomonas helleri]MQT85286.1 hypothetical protein [Pseudomonas sp. FSL R10-2964]
MKIAQIYALVGALILSSTALAEGGGDRTIARATQATEQAMEKFLAKELKKTPPKMSGGDKGPISK